MRISISILFLCNLFLLSPSLTAWELIKEHEGISVYTRDVEGSPIKAFKAVTAVESTLTALVALLEDSEAGPDWLYSCLSLKQIHSDSPTKVYNYSINDLPWPVKDRDAIIYSELEQDPNTRSVLITMKGFPNYLPKNKDYVRVPYLTGEWRIIPVKNDTIEVIYTAHIEPGGSLPDWLVNTLLIDTPLKTFIEMKKILPQKKYQLATRTYIQSP